MDEAPQFGRVVSVSGAHVIFTLDAATDGEGAAHAHVGTLVKMRTRGSILFGMISSLSIPMPSRSPDEYEYRIGELELIGEIVDADEKTGRFRRGASSSPALGDPVHLADKQDLRLVYAPPEQNTIVIGDLHQDRSLPAYVVIDDLLARHFAVVGTTGSGKSCAVSVILQRLVENHPGGRIVIMDLHGEYAQAFGALAEVIDPKSLQLPYWLLNHEELTQVVLGGDSRDMAAEADALRNLVQTAKQRFSEAKDGDSVTADTPVPCKVSDLFRILEDTMGKLEKRNDLAPYQRLKGRLDSLINDRRYAFMFPTSVVLRDNLSAILSRIFRVPVDGKPVSILDLSTVPTEIINVVIAVLCRITFDVAQWSGKSLPILLVCEEAHRYAPSKGEVFEPARRSLARIAREGRKYGISLCIVSQRPSEVSASILSQCNTMFAMRLTNENDQMYLCSAMSQAARGMLDPLPSLTNSEAIAIGEGVPVPMRVMFERLEVDKRPSSHPVAFSEAWRQELGSHEHMIEVVQRWRRQRA